MPLLLAAVLVDSTRRCLCKSIATYASVQITLIEPKAQFLFTPMMYALITDELKDGEIASTYSNLLAGKNIQ